MNEIDAKLIDAVNLLADFARHNLAPDWEISLRLTREEATIELTDPDGNDVDVYTNDASSIRECCETSQEPST